MHLFLLKDYQTSPLPLAVWRGESPAEYQADHRHDCIEMVFVKHGTGWCAINGYRYPMLRGDLYVMGEQDTHAFASKAGFVYYNIMFSRELLPPEEWRFFAPVLEKHGKYTFPAGHADKIQSLLEKIRMELQEKRPGFDILAAALFREFLVEAVRGAPRALGVAASGNHKHISQIFDYIATHYREQITLTDLAAEFGGSPEYLGRQFKKLTGMTFSSYTAGYRMEQARRLLAESSMAISDIALQLGYFDASYFSKCFQKTLGLSPKAYRQIIRSGGQTPQEKTQSPR